jgi:hypothetical protein
MLRVFGICGLLVLTLLPASGGEPLTLAVAPTVSMAPAYMRIRVRIEPSAGNRLLTIVADGSEFYRSSDVQLEGDQAPKTVERSFSNLPSGEYDIYVFLTDGLGRRRAAARQHATVMSMPDRP